MLAVLLAVGACDLVRDGTPLDAPPGRDGPPPVDDDLVPPVGSAATFDIASWNAENFPKSARAIDLLADLIASLDVDLIVFEEIASVQAWNDLLARLPAYEGVLSSHRYAPTLYQKLGFLYRKGLVTVGPAELLFTSDNYGFPRPAMKVHVEAAGLDFDAIGVHLKAGSSTDDAARRAAAVQVLDAYLRAQIDGGGEDEVVVLGDYNEVITDAEGRQVLAPLHGASDRYRFLTEPAALAGEHTFISSNMVIDHIVVTAGLYDEVGAARAVIPRLETMVPRYDPDLTDHLPVIVSIPRP